MFVSISLVREDDVWGVNFMYGLYFTLVTAVLYSISCFIESPYNGTLLYNGYMDLHVHISYLAI